VHPDHLGSTNVVTDENGAVVETLDYYPYGAERIHSGSADADRTFIGQFGDDATALSYLNARYYDPARGQFTSQDPVFLALGDRKCLDS
jgi:RHS repeat-associated protein